MFISAHWNATDPLRYATDRARTRHPLLGEFSSLRTRGEAPWSRRELSEPQQGACRVRVRSRPQRSSSELSNRRKIKDGRWNSRSPGDTEPDIAAGAIGVVAVATRRATEDGDDVPVAAAQHTVRTRRRPLRVCLRACRIVPVPVVHPLKHIARHVVQTEPVAEFAAHWTRLAVRVAIEPRNVSKQAVVVRATQLPRVAVERRCCARSVRVLPLRFRR